MRTGRRVTLPHVGIFADGVAVKQMGQHTFAVCKQFVDDCITVSNDELCAAIKAIFEETRGIVEGAGALGVAGLRAYAATHDMQGQRAVAICSGANITFERLQFVAERTLLGSGKEALFAVAMPERSGTLQAFCEQVINGHNITQVGYRLNGRDGARVLVGVGVANGADKQAFEAKMKHLGYEYTDLSTEDTAKEHIRHMIGGPAPLAQHEHVYQVNFPERPGALADFLRATAGAGNVSLFHYRGQGGDIGNVLVGFEAKSKHALEKALTQTGYEYTCADADKSLRLFA
jgi:threonine dehydratase